VNGGRKQWIEAAAPAEEVAAAPAVGTGAVVDAAAVPSAAADAAAVPSVAADAAAAPSRAGWGVLWRRRPFFRRRWAGQGPFGGGGPLFGGGPGGVLLVVDGVTARFTIWMWLSYPYYHSHCHRIRYRRG